MSQEQILSKRHRKPQETNENNNSNNKKSKIEPIAEYSYKWLLEKEQEKLSPLTANFHTTEAADSYIQQMSEFRAEIIRSLAIFFVLDLETPSAKISSEDIKKKNQFLLTNLLRFHIDPLPILNLIAEITPYTSLNYVLEKIFEEEIIYIFQYIKTNTSHFDINLKVLIAACEKGESSSYLEIHHLPGYIYSTNVLYAGSLLHFAVKSNMLMVTQWLLENGANTMLFDTEEKLSIEHAFLHKDLKIADLLLDYELNRAYWGNTKFKTKSQFCLIIWEKFQFLISKKYNQEYAVAFIKKIILAGTTLGIEAYFRTKDYVSKFLIPAFKEALVDLYKKKNSVWNIYHLQELGKNPKKSNLIYSQLNAIITHLCSILNKTEIKTLKKELPQAITSWMSQIEQDTIKNYVQRINQLFNEKNLSCHLSFDDFNNILNYQFSFDETEHHFMPLLSASELFDDVNFEGKECLIIQYLNGLGINSQNFNPSGQWI